MMFLTAIYDENNTIYTAVGLTIEEGQAIIGETISRLSIEWVEDWEDTQGLSENSVFETRGTPTAILNTLITWGWIRSDYDERLNTYILSFPEYSQLYVELFKKLQSEDDSRERESILSVCCKTGMCPGKIQPIGIELLIRCINIFCFNLKYYYQISLPIIKF